MADVMRAIWLALGILRYLPKYLAEGKPMMWKDCEWSLPMNFNDIEFRLRHPKVYLHDPRGEKWTAEARVPTEAIAESAAIPHVSRSLITRLLHAATRHWFRALSRRQE